MLTILCIFSKEEEEEDSA